MAIIVDTGPLYALADGDDQYHKIISNYISTVHDTLIVPSAVIPEVCYLLLEYLGSQAEIEFLRSLSAGELFLEHFTNADIIRAVEILEQYKDAKLGMVDATVMAMAERMKIRKIMTVDHRHFSMFRPKHCSAFQIVPLL